MSVRILKFGNRLKLSQKALVLIAVPLVFEIALVGSLLYLQYQTEQEIKREAHARKVESVVDSLWAHLCESFMKANGIDDTRLQLSQFTGNPLVAIHKDLTDLEALFSQPEQRKALAKVRQEYEREIHSVSELHEYIRENPFTASAKLTESGERWSNWFASVVETVDSLLVKERQIIGDSPKRQSFLRERIREILFVAIPFNTLIALALAWYFNQTTVDRLSTVMRNTRALAANQPLEPQVDGSDEIAILDKAFHETVRERRQIDAMKQDFVNMVSHEDRLKEDVRCLERDIDELCRKLKKKTDDLDAKYRKLRTVQLDIRDCELDMAVAARTM